MSKPDLPRARTHVTALHTHPIDVDCSLAIFLSSRAHLRERGSREGEEGMAARARNGAYLQTNQPQNTIAKSAGVLTFSRLHKAMGMEPGSLP
jgi:hypothetical protein